MGDILLKDEREVARVPLHLDVKGRPVLVGEREGGDPEADDERGAEGDHRLPEQSCAVYRR